MAKRVLVPLDGTKNAEAALASLRQLCEREDELVLIKVEKPAAPTRRGYVPGEYVSSPAVGVTGAVTPDVPVFAETTDQVSQRQLNESKDYLEGLAANLRTAGYKVVTEVLIDEKPAQAIIDYARRTQPTFIAMLRRTHPELAEIFFGSVASSIARSDVAPVLFVPSPA
jgi:nucleotide-binding universal stress UspA family protein